MEWLARNASTIVVLLVLAAIVAAIIRSMVKNRSVGGCSGDCGSCGSACATPKLKLTPEQEEQLRRIDVRRDDLLAAKDNESDTEA